MSMTTYLYLYLYVAVSLLSGIAASVVEGQQILTDNISEYDTYASEHHDGYSVRIKEQDGSLCKAKSRQYTGWLDFQGKSIFFCM